MKQFGKRLVTLTLALLMAMSVLPEEWHRSARAAGAYGKVTADGVKLRKKASTSAAYWFKLDTGYVCQVLDVTASGDITWYNVEAVHPDPGSTRTYIGYIHGDFFTPLTEQEATEYEANGKLEDSSADTSTDTAPDTSTGDTSADDAAKEEDASREDSSADTSTGSNTNAYAGATGQITNDGVNFRESEGGNMIRKLDRGTVVEVLTIPPVIDTNHWYKVRYAGDVGYIMSTFLQVVSTGDPNGTPTDPDADLSLYGYVKLVLSSANLRLTPAGTVGAQWEKTGEVLAVVAPPVTEKNFVWYPVEFEGNRYYVREDTVQLQATPGSSGSSSSTGGTTTTPTIVGYVRTTKSGVNLRLKPAGTVVTQINKGEVLPMIANVTKDSGYYWYNVQTPDNVRGYLRGDCVVVCNADGSNIESGSTPVVTDPPAATSYGHVKTIKDKVNLRTKPAGSSQEQIALGVVVPMIGKKVKSGSYYWYPVKAASGKTGYLRSDCVMECNSDGSNFAPIVTTPPSSSGQEASYTTLKLGSSGTAVKNLVEELKNQGYYSGDVTSSYTSAVEAAVRAFQTAKGLTVDGIAGSQTQHALFGTVPIGSGDSSNLSFTHYPAEKIDWFTGGIQQLWPKGANYKIYDVKTGIVWWAHRWSGFNHADIETLTAADTARLCKIYGVSKASEINNKKHWHRRPCLVTIGTRTFACSLYGVPHNPDGDTIPDNDMIGQLCLHFTNSMTSDTKVVDTNHQKAIDYAYQNAPGGQKK